MFLLLPVRPSMEELERAVAVARRRMEDERALELAAERLAAERRLRHQLLEIGASLSAEPDLDRLLGRILSSARSLVQADAGSLYLLEDRGATGARLRFLLAQNDSCEAPAPEGSLKVDSTSIAGMVAMTGRPLRIDDVESIPANAPYTFNRSFDRATGYTTRSVLAVPMTDRRGQPGGGLQLINRKRAGGARLTFHEDLAGQVVPFTDRDEELLRALAAQAAVVIENSRLVLEIQQLFEAFVRAAVTAIEQRDPPTSGHSARVAVYTVNLARAVDRDSSPAWMGVGFSSDAIRQLRYAALLHDVGKLGVRESVLTKSAKLYPYQDELIRERFFHARRALQLAAVEERLGDAVSGGRPDDATMTELKAAL
ncbi:MAG TPA: GAF domain-containing protein, partial [Acidobacteria bacterium]|nr:GAF domain-containing protein [Acidobacteriota bacterium]